MKQQPSPWYCSDHCKTRVLSKDHIQQYSYCLIYRGLLQMADSRMERFNDGPGMLSLWKINMLDFFKNNHTKYLILGHRLLASMLCLLHFIQETFLRRFFFYSLLLVTSLWDCEIVLLCFVLLCLTICLL